MKKAALYSIPAPQSPGYVWEWRSSDGKTRSKGSFAYYHDCLADARAQGYEVELSAAHGNTAPGGARHNLP